MSTVGPHRDELALLVGGLPARTHASQGEQRTLALALRLAVHQVVGEVAGTSPVLLLDDVFSELDPARTEELARGRIDHALAISVPGPAQRIFVQPGYDQALLRDLGKYFEAYSAIQLANYPVAGLRGTPVPTGAG